MTLVNLLVHISVVSYLTFVWPLFVPHLSFFLCFKKAMFHDYGSFTYIWLNDKDCRPNKKLVCLG